MALCVAHLVFSTSCSAFAPFVLLSVIVFQAVSHQVRLSSWIHFGEGLNPFRLASLATLSIGQNLHGEQNIFKIPKNIFPMKNKEKSKTGDGLVRNFNSIKQNFLKIFSAPSPVL